MTVPGVAAATTPGSRTRALSWLLSDDLPLRVRLQRAAFAMTATTLLVVFTALSAVALVELPAVRLEANTQIATVIGASLTANLRGRLQDIARLGRNPLMYTALTDSGEREIYLKPFLESLRVGDEHAPVLLLDYRGREVAGRLPAGIEFRNANPEALHVLATRERRLAVVPGGEGAMLLAAFPVTAPYTHDVIGVVMGAVDLAALLRANSTGLAEGLGAALVLDGREVARWPGTAGAGYLAAERPVLVDRGGFGGNLDLAVYSTTHPWLQSMLVRTAVSLVVGAALLYVFWRFSGLFARRVTRRLDHLAGDCGAIADGKPAVIAEDPARDEVGTLARTLRAAFAAYDRVNDNLEALVDARTRSLAEREEQLRGAMHAAEAASEAKTAFLRNMSHELRTPLNGIMGMTFLLRRSGLGGEQAARLEKIDVSARRLLAIVTEVLQFSKLQTGDVVLQQEPLDLPALVAEVVAGEAEQARTKGVRIDVQLAAGDDRLVGDREWLREALHGYVANAVKFTAAGSVTVRTRREDAGPDAVVVHFEVADTGNGIAPEELARLFTGFEQVDNSSTRAHGGAGLGLAITRRIARLMGGDAGAQSTPGTGSTFWFTARLRRAPAGA